MGEIRILTSLDDLAIPVADYPMHHSAKCGARTRNGTPCEAPAVAGKKRCRMHGGAAGSGAPKGNKNALKHGEYTAENKAALRQLRELTRRTLAGLKP